MLMIHTEYEHSVRIIIGGFTDYKNILSLSYPTQTYNRFYILPNIGTVKKIDEEERIYP